MTNHDFFCECTECCEKYDENPGFTGPATFADTRPALRQNGVKAAPVRTRYMKPGQAVGRGRVRRPSEKQLSFLRSLIAQRDITNLMLPRGVDRSVLNNLEEISLRGCSDLIDNLKDCPKKHDVRRMATEGQMKFIRSLIGQKYPSDRHEELNNFFGDTMTFDDASKMINHMKTLPDAETKVVLEEGVYRYEDNAARVVHSNNGRVYASLWNAETQDWDYTPGLSTLIKPEDRMTLAEMAAFGQAFGRCGHCNRKLTKKESMEAGIGPICATHY